MAQARTLLARAKALVSAGRPEEALPLLENARAEGERVAFRPLEAEALLLRAHAEMKLGRDADAGATLERAMLAAQAGRDDASSAAAAAELVINAARRADEIETTRAERYARAWLERIGGDLRLESRIESGLGVLHYMKGTFGQSVAHYQKGIVLLERAGGDLDPESPRSHTNLASSLTYLGRYAEAITHVEAALRALDATVGPDHPDRAFAAVRLSEIYLRLGRRAEARPHLERALVLHEGRDAFAAAPLALLGILFDDDGEPAVALRHAEKAHLLYERTDGKDGPLTLDTLSIVGTVLRHQGRSSEALAAHERVLSGFENTPGNDDAIIGTVHAEIARDFAELGRRDDAKAAFERALRLHKKREATGETHMDIAADLEGLGTLELTGKTPRAALPLFRRALELAEPRLGLGAAGGAAGNDAPALVKYLVGLGRAELAVGATKDALSHLERAEKLLLRERWPARTLGELRFALARALAESGGDAERSAALAAQAEQDFRVARLQERAAEVARWRREAPLAAR